MDFSVFTNQLIGTAPAAVAVIITVKMFMAYLAKKDEQDQEERNQMRKELHELVSHNDRVLERNSTMMAEMTTAIRSLACSADRTLPFRKYGQ